MADIHLVATSLDALEVELWKLQSAIEARPPSIRASVAKRSPIQRFLAPADPQDSVTAIKEISGTIERLSEISSAIAAPVEQQGAATQEISRNVQKASQGTQQVSANITDVQRGATETGSASSQVLSATQSLSVESNRLKVEVSRFLDSVRAA